MADKSYIDQKWFTVDAPWGDGTWIGVVVANLSITQEPAA